MARIEWQPLAIPEIGDSALRAQQASANAIRGAFQDLSGVVDQWKGQRREENLTELYRRQNRFAVGAVGPDGKPTGIPDVAGYVGDLADGDLINDLSYLNAADIAAARSYTGELRSGRAAEETRNRGIVVQGREDQAHTRSMDDLASGVIVARESNRIQAAVRNGTMTPEEGATAAAQLAALTNNAGQINSAFASVEQGIEGNRSNVRWDREGVTYADGREDRQFTVKERNDRSYAARAIEKIQELNGNFNDLQESEDYRNANPEQRILMRQAFGSTATPPSPAGAFAPEEDGGTTLEDFLGRMNPVEARSDTDRPRNRDGSLASSALGRGQFLERTWLDLISRNSPDLTRGKTRAEILALRSNPTVNAAMQRVHATENMNRLRDSGIPINNGTQYAAWFLGAGTAVNLYRADRNASVRTVVSQAALDANENVFNPRRGPPIRTVGDLQDWAARKMSRPSLSREQIQGNSNAMVAGAAVAQGTDQFAYMEEEVVKGLADSTDISGVAQRLVGPEGRFAGQNENRIGALIRSVQDRYERIHPGSSLNASAAAAILTHATVPGNGIRDGFGNVLGVSEYVNPSGGMNQRIVDWRRAGEAMRRIAPDQEGRIRLADTLTNNQNRRATYAVGTTSQASLETLRQALLVQQGEDRRLGRTRNPVTQRMARDLAAAEASFSDTVVEREELANR